MATFKITQISEDFKLKSKDVLDIFTKELRIDKKSGATVDTEEFDLFIQKITLTHQIKDIDKYTGGESVIRIIPDAPEAKAEPKTEAKAPEAKVEPKTEAKVPEVKAEPKT